MGITALPSQTRPSRVALGCTVGVVCLSSEVVGLGGHSPEQQYPCRNPVQEIWVGRRAQCGNGGSWPLKETRRVSSVPFWKWGTELLFFFPCEALYLFSICIWTPGFLIGRLVSFRVFHLLNSTHVSTVRWRAFLLSLMPLPALPVLTRSHSPKPDRLCLFFSFLVSLR